MFTSLKQRSEVNDFVLRQQNVHNFIIFIPPFPAISAGDQGLKLQNLCIVFTLLLEVIGIISPLFTNLHLTMRVGAITCSALCSFV